MNLLWISAFFYRIAVVNYRIGLFLPFSNLRAPRMSILALKTKNIMEHKTLQFFQRPLQPGCLFSFLFFLMAFFLSQEAVRRKVEKLFGNRLKKRKMEM